MYGVHYDSEEFNPLFELTREYFSQKKARDVFLKHISKNSLVVKTGILFGLFISDLPLINKLPFLNQVASLSKSLWAGHITETNFCVFASSQNKSLHQPLRSHAKKEIFDYIVIGSGPGAVSALANIPEQSTVLVIEKGKFSDTPHENYHSLSHISEEFEKSGQEFIFTWPISQFAQGSVLGGGSEVNSGLYHRLPEVKLPEYLRALNIDSSVWQGSQNWVESLLKINSVAKNSKLSVIARGATNMGLEYKNIPRWRTYETESKFVHHGMNNVFWINFEGINPARQLKTNLCVKRIESGKFLKIVCRDQNNSEVTYFSRKLILGAGAIGTPYLLASSGLINWKDTRFQWHPMVRTIVKTNSEDLGSTDIDPFQAWTNDHAIKFGSGVSTPGLLAIGLSREIHKHEFSFLRSYYGSFVSSGRGGLVPGSKIPWYKFSKFDHIQMSTAKKMLEDLMVHSGAKFADRNEKIKKGISTVHIFGTLPSSLPIYINGTNRLKTCENILICDSSILPFGPGVNPQGIIMATIKSMTEFLKHEVD